MVGKFFSASLRDDGKVLLDSTATLHFDPVSQLGTGEKAELTTCFKANQGMVLHAVSKSKTMERYWEVLVLPGKPHQNGNHCLKYKVEITSFHETPLSKSKR